MALQRVCAVFAALFLLLSLSGRAFGVSAKVGDGLARDAQALLAFREGITQDPFEALRDWGTQPNPCRWHGVECARAGAEIPEQRVVGLELVGLELRGSVSPAIGKLSELRQLAMVGSHLAGKIPSDIRRCRKLVSMDLRANELSAVGFRLADFPLLEELKLSENRFTDALGVLFGERAKSLSEGLNIFRFYRDQKTAPDSKSTACPRLRVLDLAKNRLVGNVAEGLGRCLLLSEVSLNDNELTGGIPTSLGALSNLHSLSLSRNRLDGRLPESIALGCKKLAVLDVADNLLSGTIPVEFAAFRGFRRFSFSNNHLEGLIPQGNWGVRQMALEGMFSGNDGLCGWPLPHDCGSGSSKRIPAEVLSQPSSGIANLYDKGVTLLVNVRGRFRLLGEHVVSSGKGGRGGFEKVPLRARRSMADNSSTTAPVSSPGPSPAPRKKNNHDARRWALGLVLGIVAGALAAILLATVFHICMLCVQKVTYLHGPIIFIPSITPKMLNFLEKDEFSTPEDLVGEGGVGQVYKAKLDNAMVIAVKKVKVSEDQTGLLGKRQIQAELETLGCIRHRNLVVLLAYMHRPDSHLLVYEYMPNGSLHSALRKVGAGELELPWPIRHRIAVGTSRGLSYLHFESNPKIMHRDLKPSNILLDGDFVAHVADFGLAKVLPGADTHVTTDVAGTVGYIAPEYSQTWRFTDKSDVYSFGVVLAVLVTGKDPTDQFFQTAPGGTMGTWLQDLMHKGEGKDAIDPNLRTGDGEFEDEILLAMKIAVFCTNENAAERPTSSEVNIMLKDIRPDPIA